MYLIFKTYFITYKFLFGWGKSPGVISNQNQTHFDCMTKGALQFSRVEMKIICIFYNNSNMLINRIKPRTFGDFLIQNNL